MEQIHVESLHVRLKPVLPDQVRDEDNLDNVYDGKATVPEEDVRSTCKTPCPDTKDYMSCGQARMEPHLPPVAGGEEIAEEEDSTCQMEEKAVGQAVCGGAGCDGGVASHVGIHHLKLIIDCVN